MDRMKPPRCGVTIPFRHEGARCVGGFRHPWAIGSGGAVQREDPNTEPFVVADVGASTPRAHG
jgi:hypothetical protein